MTFRKDVLQHLGIQPGQKIRLDLLPDGKATLSADRPSGSWGDIQTVLRGKTNGARLSIEDIATLTAEAGATAGRK
ncbi:MAG: hypothetical protein ACRED4_03265 [Brevundimonas sp.]